MMLFKFLSRKVYKLTAMILPHTVMTKMTETINYRDLLYTREAQLTQDSGKFHFYLKHELKIHIPTRMLIFITWLGFKLRAAMIYHDDSITIFHLIYREVGSPSTRQVAYNKKNL